MIDKTSLVRWEAFYLDDTVIREEDGVKYKDIPRLGLEEFRLVYDGLTIFTARPPVGADGHNLRYRITREVGPDGSVRMIRLGWVPYGPAFLIDANAIDTSRTGIWIADQGFHDCDNTCDHPIGWFELPQPVGSETVRGE